MALINCPECKKQISNQAKLCPHCGYKLRLSDRITEEDKKEELRVWEKVLFSFILITICYFLLLYFFEHQEGWVHPIYGITYREIAISNCSDALMATEALAGIRRDKIKVEDDQFKDCMKILGYEWK